MLDMTVMGKERKRFELCVVVKIREGSGSVGLSRGIRSEESVEDDESTSVRRVLLVLLF